MKTPFIISVAVLLFLSFASAQIPRIISSQGYMEDSTGHGVTASLPMTFRLFADSTGGVALLTQTFGSVPISSGVYNAVLDVSSLSFNIQYWLETEVNAQTLSPRARLTSVPYALQALSLLGPNSVASGTAAVAGGSNNRARGIYSTVGGGGGFATIDSNSATGSLSTIGGGSRNTASGDFGSTVGGGYGNIASRDQATVAGGRNDTASGSIATVGGGYANAASGDYATISGGRNNIASGGNAMIGGGAGNTASGLYYSTVGGGGENTASGRTATVGGGGSNVASGEGAFIGGGLSNSALGDFSVVSGGGGSSGNSDANSAQGNQSTVAGGKRNIASGDFSVVSGGSYNIASGKNAFIGGGVANFARGMFSVVSGGGGDRYLGGFVDSNSALGSYSTVPGGTRNKALGDYSFAAGRRAKALNNGAFVWGDSTDADFASTQDNQFLIRASGGVGIGTTTPNSTLSLYNSNESGTLTDLTQSLIRSGVNIITDYTAGAYTPGLFWSTQNNNPDKPKAGIWLLENSTGTTMNFGTSDTFSLGINSNSTALVINQSGNVGIGTTTPQGALDVNSTTGAFIVPRMTTTQRDALTAVNGMIIYNTTTNAFNFREAGAWVTK